MRIKVLLGILLVACLLTTLGILPVKVAADELLKTDFEKESFDKTVDYFDYARAYALLHGLPKPQNFWHAYTYLTYVNKMGLQMLYSGLCNISLADQAYLTIPMQTLLLHYKTENNSRDALVASSFLMLMGFNDTENSIYANSPDKNDTLWASFSLGLNLKQIFPNVDFPAFNSKSEIFPLTPSEDKLTWKWGMRYTNLTALWVTAHITGAEETNTSRPLGLATYEELTFNYTLTIDPDSHTATIRQDHAIGRMRDLWVFWGWFFVPLYNHYNSTGCYRYGEQVPGEPPIYEYLHKYNVRMSIVNLQTTVLLDRSTYSESANGQNVTNNDVFVGNTSIATYADDGEKIVNASFGAKETYNLFDYTEDPAENTPHTYEAVTRTTQIDGYARNEDLFALHKAFAMYLPLILVHMYPQMYQQAKDTITNMTRADYLYLISYPNYSGYRIEHDPVLTAYFAPAAATPNLGGLILLAAIAGIIIVATVIVLKRRHPRQPPQMSAEQPPQQPPEQPSATG